MPADHTAGPYAGLAGTIDLAGQVSVNRLGFGAMRIPGIWGEPEAAPAGHRILRRAIELGVNFMDTAHAYGVSEQRIGEALFPYKRDLVVATKCGYERNADGRPETIRTQVVRSLELLRLERIELLQLHTVDPAVPIEESVGAMVELQTQGKVRLIGVSNVSVEQLARARSVGEIVSVQNRYSLGDRRSDEVLAVCEQNGIAFLPYFPLAAGVLVQAQELQDVATARGATAAQVALAWLLQRSPVMLPIPGTSSLAHLEENVAAAGLRLSRAEFDRLSWSA
jgi:pyridoxine 4-dehydrogenase